MSVSVTMDYAIGTIQDLYLKAWSLICLFELLLLDEGMYMISTDQVLEHATKEHTPAFKKAVESFKASNPEKKDSAFAIVTSAFKKANKPIFLSSGIFNLSDPFFEIVELAKHEEHKAELSSLKKALNILSESNIPSEAKRMTLRKLFDTAKEAGIASTELAALDEEGILAEFKDYSSEVLLQDIDPKLTDKVVLELSGVALKWESLGHALRVTGELMKPGVFQGIDGKKCRWTDEVLMRDYKSLYGKPVRMFHKAEGIYKKLPVSAGEVVGHITHLAEYFGRIFYKALVFPKRAQSLIQHGYKDTSGKQHTMKESLEAHVALTAADKSGVHNIKAWQGIGFAFTDTPAVSGRDDIETDPVALTRNQTMGNPNPDGTEGSGDPQTPPASPAVPQPQVTLSASDMQNMIKTAVGEATTELSTKIKELSDQNTQLSTDLKELADVRNEARLAEITAMEEDIKVNDPAFKPEMLYDPEKTSLAQKKHDLDIYIRGINLGAKLKTEQKPAIQLAEGQGEDESWLDEASIAQFGKKYDAMLAAPPVQEGGST